MSPDPKFKQERCYQDVILCLFIPKIKLLPGQLRQIKAERNPDAGQTATDPLRSDFHFHVEVFEEGVLVPGDCAVEITLERILGASRRKTVRS